MIFSNNDLTCFALECFFWGISQAIWFNAAYDDVGGLVVTPLGSWGTRLTLDMGVTVLARVADGGSFLELKVEAILNGWLMNQIMTNEIWLEISISIHLTHWLALGLQVLIISDKWGGWARQDWPKWSELMAIGSPPLPKRTFSCPWDPCMVYIFTYSWLRFL